MKIGFIGAGNMGSALASAASKCKDVSLYVYDKNTKLASELAERLGGKFAEAKDIAKDCDYVFLAVKPNIIPFVAAEIKSSLKKDAVIVSMAAGISIAKIEGFFETNPPIIRIMPNTPVSVGAGLILWCKNKLVSDEKAEEFINTMAHAGSFDKIDEEKIDAASAISGCGPAFVYMFIEALADGGVQCGLPRAAAQKYAEATVLGATTAAPCPMKSLNLPPIPLRSYSTAQMPSPL